MSPRLILKGNIVLTDRVLADAMVTCENGRIAAIEENSGSLKPGVIDLSGHFIAPGFVDIHVHGAAGADYMDGTPEAVRRTSIRRPAGAIRCARNMSTSSPGTS